MSADYPPKKNAIFTFYVGLQAQSQANTLQSSATLAAGDVKVSTDGGALANLGTLPVVTPAASKAILVTLSAAEMNGDDIVVIFNDAAGAEWKDVLIHIKTVTRQMVDLAYPATSGRSLVVDAAGLADALTVKVGPTGAGTVQTAGDLKASITALQDFNPATQTVDVGKVAGIAAAATNLSNAARSVISATVDTGVFVATTTQLQSSTAGLSATTDFYKGRIIIFYGSATLAGQATDITAYDGVNKRFTYTALTTAPANTDTFVIV